MIGSFKQFISCSIDAFVKSYFTWRIFIEQFSSLTWLRLLKKYFLWKIFPVVHETNNTYKNTQMNSVSWNRISCCILHKWIVWFKFILIIPRRVLHVFSCRIPKPSVFFEIMPYISEIKHFKVNIIKTREVVAIIVFWA